MLCKNAAETKNHLFFYCSYSSQLWKHLTLGILRGNHTNVWSSIVTLISGNSLSKMSSFCVRYSFQAAVYAIWRERNKAKHGEQALPISILKKLTKKGVRNKLSLMRMKRGRGLEGGLQFWFGTRV